MKIKKKIFDRIYDFVLYNYKVKKKIFWLFRSPLTVKNPIYKFFYENEIKFKMIKYKKIPFKIMIENTNVCNAACTFCPHNRMGRKTGFMKFSLFKKIVDECKLLGINYIGIQGFGEPLLDPNFTKEIEYAKSNDIERVITNTNGDLLTPEIGKKLIEVGLDEIYISVDAATEEIYKKLRPPLNFNRVEKNIKTLMELRKKSNNIKPLVILSYVESDINKNETKYFISKWKGIVDDISISQIHNWTGDIRHGGAEFNCGMKDPCRLIWTEMVINWDGIVPLCCNDYDARAVLGNLNENSIKEIWNNEKITNIRSYHRSKKFDKISICKSCEYNYHDKSNWWVSK